MLPHCFLLGFEFLQQWVHRFLHEILQTKNGNPTGKLFLTFSWNLLSYNFHPRDLVLLSKVIHLRSLLWGKSHHSRNVKWGITLICSLQNNARAPITSWCTINYPILDQTPTNEYLSSLMIWAVSAGRFFCYTCITDQLVIFNLQLVWPKDHWQGHSLKPFPKFSPAG